MSLLIPTFTHNPAQPARSGGETLFKALGHPLAAPAAALLVARLARAPSVAVYDPDSVLGSFDAMYPLAGVRVTGFYVQRIEELAANFAGHPARPVSEIGDSKAPVLFLVAFDAKRHADTIRHLLPAGTEIVSLDEMRIGPEMLSNPGRYLDPVNFATNFALLLESGGTHTRISTVNYWSTYGAADPSLWLRLYDQGGAVLAEWNQGLPAAGAGVHLDSAEIRRRFGLGEFEGSLFIHAIRIKGHAVVKYAMDLYDDSGRELSATHDANAWPADFYAGLPAPAPGERVRLWVQNSHPIPIPAGGIGFGLMGGDHVAAWPQAIAPFASVAIDVAEVLPDAKWPQQIEVHAGRHFVRPRYEIQYGDGRRRIAHANVERTDLKPDPNLPGAMEHLGRGYLLPFPILPLDQFDSFLLPTPMARGQADLPIAIHVFDAEGTLVAEKFLGKLQRSDSIEIDLRALLGNAAAKLESGYGHAELVYDFREGGGGDGWLHAIARFRRHGAGEAAETSFGAHIYNVPVVYRDEPQSYTGTPPGLTTRLFLRLGGSRADALCHLIYPASGKWHDRSTTSLNLFDAEARQIASRDIKIARGGSYFFRARQTFTAAELTQAGETGYVQVRDVTCRLFGFQGLINDPSGFALDHMFGF